MIEPKLPNKTKSATVAEPKHFRQLKKLIVEFGGELWDLIMGLARTVRSLAHSNKQLAQPWSISPWMEMDQPIQPPLLVTLRAGGDGTTGLVESVLE
jgi:hypothetical protein